MSKEMEFWTPLSKNTQAIKNSCRKTVINTNTSELVPQNIFQ